MTQNSKIWLKYMIVLFLYYSGVIYVFSMLKPMLISGNRCLILMYHKVVSEDDDSLKYLQPGMYVLERNFQKQISYLAAKRTIIPLRKLARHLKENANLQKNYVAITFDDGWRDNFDVAYPVLENNNVPATIFLTTDFIGTNTIPWFYQLHQLLAKFKLVERESMNRVIMAINQRSLISDLDAAKITEMNPMDTDRIMEIVKDWKQEVIDDLIENLKTVGDGKSGISGDRLFLDWNEIDKMGRDSIYFESHGCSHKIMTKMNKDDVFEELSRSKRIIEEKTGKTVQIFSYPNGNYDPEIASLVEQAGYIAAVATRPSAELKNNNRIFELERIGIHDSTSKNPRGRFSRAMFAYTLSGFGPATKKLMNRFTQISPGIRE